MFDNILLDSVVELIEKNPSVAGPIFTIQVKLRQALINGEFWIDMTNKRSSGIMSFDSI